MTRDEMIARWESRASLFAECRAQVDGETVAKQVLADLESMAESEQAVTLTEAAKQTGYSADHLSRMLKDRKLTNYGRKHAPAVRLSECPKKPALAVSSGKAYNADADARSLLTTRRLQGRDNAS